MTTSAITGTGRLSEFSRVQLILKLTYGLVPIVAGLDKFTNLLTDWSKYLKAELIPVDPSVFMVVVGVIEIGAGILIFLRTELGAYVVAAWLVCIALTLILSQSFLDVAVRDIVMAIGAFTLARLTRIQSGNEAS